MNLTAFIDVAIGLSLVYLGVSLYVTIVNEFIAQKLSLRGKQLALDLKTLIDDNTLIEKLKLNPSLRPFFDETGKRSSYVDPESLARLLVGAVRVAPTAVATMQDFVGAIDALPPSKVKDQLAALAQSASWSVDKFVESVSRWADQSLTMMGEIYKKRMQVISFCIGLVSAIAFNVDTLTIATHLYRNKEARDATVAFAIDFAKRTQPDAIKACMDKTLAQRAADKQCAPILGLVDTFQSRDKTLGQIPIIWKSWDEAATALKESVPGYNWIWVGHWIGWLITALAVSLGAPFWFDLLNRLINVRHGMTRPKSTVGA